jgi:hypothetical protein
MKLLSEVIKVFENERANANQIQGGESAKERLKRKLDKILESVCESDDLGRGDS